LVPIADRKGTEPATQNNAADHVRSGDRVTGSDIDLLRDLNRVVDLLIEG
jgi:hypothetical protein